MLTYRRFSRKSSIICIFIKYEKYLFSVSRILTLAALDSRLELYIREPIEVSNPDTILQTLVSLGYAMNSILYDA
jgi:hypothetical protein